MPLKLNIGLAQKIGQPGYSSLSASCHVEVELDSSLIQSDLDAFHRHVKNAFNACRQSVQDELARQQISGTPATGSADTAQVHLSTGHGRTNGHGTTNGNSHHSHRASQKQLVFANQLAKGIRGLGMRRLESLAEKMFNKPLADLSTLDASCLIDMLKAIKEERISLDDALRGVTA